jgi:hypothetical protein
VNVSIYASALDAHLKCCLVNATHTLETTNLFFIHRPVHCSTYQHKPEFFRFSKYFSSSYTKIRRVSSKYLIKIKIQSLVSFVLKIAQWAGRTSCKTRNTRLTQKMIHRCSINSFLALSALGYCFISISCSNAEHTIYKNLD